MTSETWRRRWWSRTSSDMSRQTSLGRSWLGLGFSAIGARSLSRDRVGAQPRGDSLCGEAGARAGRQRTEDEHGGGEARERPPGGVTDQGDPVAGVGGDDRADDRDADRLAELARGG